MDLIEADPFGLRLVGMVRVDARDQASLARAVLTRTVDLDAHDWTLLTRGDILQDWYESWLEPERERRRHLRLHALERLAELMVNESRYAEAVDVALVAVGADPLRESAQRALIKTYLAEQNYAEALGQYRRYCDLARRRLGTRPSPELDRLIAEIDASDCQL